MGDIPLTQDELKKAAGLRALEYVRSDSVVGLGTGSTVKHAIIGLGEALRDGRLSGIVAVPTSLATEELARSFNIPLIAWDGDEQMDVAIDGADEIDPSLQLIKGLGGALLREKHVERRAKTLVIVVDASKCVAKLGTRCPLPLEIERDSADRVSALVKDLGAKPVARMDGESLYLSDNGNHILDLHFEEGIADPRRLAQALEALPHFEEHGLFLDMAKVGVVADADGVRLVTADAG